MYQTIFSNMFMIGFYLYFFNKFCANYLKTQFGKSIISIIYLIIIYKIVSIEYIIKNIILISFIGLISYENDYINNKIGCFDKNEKIKNIQKYLIILYDNMSHYFNYIFIFYDKIVEYFKNDYLNLSGNIIEIDSMDNTEIEIMLNKMKEMLSDIDISNIKKKVKCDTVNNIDNDKNMTDDNTQNINNMENFLNNIISEIQPLLNNESLENNNFILNNITKDIIKINKNTEINLEYDKKIKEYYDDKIQDEVKINEYGKINEDDEINEYDEINVDNNEDVENFEEYIT